MISTRALAFRGLADGLRGAVTGARNLRERRFDEEQQAERTRQQAEQMAFLQSIQREATERAAAQQDADFAREGITRIADPLANASGRAMDAVPTPAMGRLPGMTMTQGSAPRGFTPITRRGNVEYAKTGPSERERMAQEQRTLLLTTRAEDRDARSAELEQQQAFNLQRDADNRAAQERIARIAAGSRPQPQPQLLQGNDGFMYQYSGGQMVRVPIAGGGQGGGQTMPPAQPQPTAQGPRRSAFLDNIGVPRTPAPAVSGTAQPAQFTEPERGPFGKAPGAGGGLETDAVRRSKGVLNQINYEANRLFTIPEPSGMERLAGNAPFVGRQFQGPDAQSYMDAASSFAQHYLYALSGQAAPEGEAQRVARAITPQLFDTEEAKAQKKQRIGEMLSTVQMLSGQQGPMTGGLPLDAEFPNAAIQILEARMDGYSDDEIRAFLTGARR